MKVVMSAIVGFFAVVMFAPSAGAAGKLLLNTGIRQPFTTASKTGFVDLIVKEAFQRVGLSAEVIVYQNSAKSLKNANLGIDDGAALRIKGLEKKFPNLIRVPEKVMDNDFVAYSVSAPIITGSWSTLDGAKIAYINGWQIFQNNLKYHRATLKTKNAQQMFDMMSAGKIDFMLYERWQGLWRAKQMGLQIHASEPPLAKREMFMYLHNKHAVLIEKVSRALIEMKRDSTYKKIFDQTLGSLR